MRSLNLRSQATLKCASNRAPRKQTNYTGNDELNRSSVTPETATEGALISFTRRIIPRSRGCHFVPRHQLQPTAPSPNHVLCRMLPRAASPTPEGNLTDNPRGKLNLASNSVVFSSIRNFSSFFTDFRNDLTHPPSARKNEAVKSQHPGICSG